MRILLAALTTRALAESARRAGQDVVSVDLFGDLDQERLCENVSLRGRGLVYSAEALLEVARELRYDAVVYGGGLENHPEVVEALAAGRTLLGNDAATLRRVREPATLFACLAARGFRVPAIRRWDEPPPCSGRWLEKPVRGGGGQGIRPWTGGAVAEGRMLQERLDGVSGSVIFVADGARAAVLGWTEQRRGPREFLYGGNVLPLDAGPAALDEACALAAALTGEFGLRGLNGADFVLAGGRPVTVEVNPRYCASMELIDRAGGGPVFELHVRGCRGLLPAVARLRSGYHGKAIVYAPRALEAGDPEAWIARGVRDVPHPGTVIRAGHPVCTVFAEAPERGACEARLDAEMTAVLADCRARAAP